LICCGRMCSCLGCLHLMSTPPHSHSHPTPHPQPQPHTSNLKKVSAIHKANIMKKADGLFIECCREVAERYPDIKYEELIVDNTCMQLVRPLGGGVGVRGSASRLSCAALGFGVPFTCRGRAAYPSPLAPQPTFQHPTNPPNPPPNPAPGPGPHPL